MYAVASDALDGLIDGTGVVRVVSKPGLDLKSSFWTDERSKRHVPPAETEKPKAPVLPTRAPAQFVPKLGGVRSDTA
jgi:hypothetical protein